jgi:hypothetical protein
MRTRPWSLLSRIDKEVLLGTGVNELEKRRLQMAAGAGPSCTVKG